MRVRARALAGLWLLVGVAVWNGFFDLYVSRGAREYGQKQAEADLGLGPRVSMTEVMNNATHDGLVGASLWAVGVVGAGWATIWLTGAGKRTEEKDYARHVGTGH